jgi:mono/diheme cytochrome c family protein
VRQGACLHAHPCEGAVCRSLHRLGGREKKKLAAKADDPNKVWVLADLVARGEKVYAANCAACHQANGKEPVPSSRWTAVPVVLAPRPT